MRKRTQLASGIIAITVLMALNSVAPLPWKGQNFMHWVFAQVGQNIDRRPRITAWGAVAFAAGIGTVIGSTCFLFAAETGLTGNPFFYLITTTVLALFLDLARAWLWFWAKPKLIRRLTVAGYEAIKHQAWWVASKLTPSDYRRMVEFDFDWFNAYRRCAAITIACSATAVAMSQASLSDTDSARWALDLPRWTQMGPDWMIPTLVGGLVMTILTLSRETTIRAVVSGRHLYQRSPDPQQPLLRFIAGSNRSRPGSRR